MNGSTERVSLSLPSELVEGFSSYMEKKGYDNRSQAVAELIRNELLWDREDDGDEVFAGSITLFYSEDRSALPLEISSLQRSYIDQVISSLHVLLEENQVMEVLVVQGPIWKLRQMAAKFVSLKGVVTGKLTLTSAVLPPVYEKKNKKEES